MQIKNILTLAFTARRIRRRRFAWQRHCCSLMLLGIGLISVPGATFSPTQPARSDLQTLTPEESQQHALAGGELHRYQFLLAANQFARVIVQQKGIDVVVTIYAPDGRKLVQSDRTNGAHGPETISLIAATGGSYSLQVTSLERITARGVYEIRLEKPRAPQAQDPLRIAAEQASINAEQLRATATAESLRQAVAEFNRAVTLWHAQGEKYEEAVALYGLGLSQSTMGNNQAALGAFKQSLLFWQTLNDPFGRAAALIGEGWAWLYLGENEKALTAFSQAVTLHRNTDNMRGLGMALYGMGWVYANLDENARAIENFTASLQLRRQIAKYRDGER